MANDKDPVFCAADIIKRAKLAKEFKTANLPPFWVYHAPH